MTTLFARSALRCVTALAAVTPVAAWAQDGGTLLEPAVPLDYSRGRNVSVAERPRPDYDPIGVRAGAFLIYPQLQTGIGYTDNVYLADADKRSDGFVTVMPSVRVASDWSRHQLLASAGLQARLFFDNGLRNQEAWYVNLLGRADLGSNFAVTTEAQGAKTYESPFSGGVASNIAVLSSYQRRTAILRGEYTNERVRLTAAVDFNSFDFDDVRLTDDRRLLQTDRDRDIWRGTLTGEYAVSPSLSVYLQGSYAGTDYDRVLLNGLPNRESNAVRVLAGTTLDVTSLIRANIGIGWTSRDFDARRYHTVSGFSFEAKAEYFPSELTTFTIAGYRVLQDAAIADFSAYFETLGSVRVDHELRENVLVNASFAYGKQDFVDFGNGTSFYQAHGGVRYLLSRSVALRADVTYNSRDRRDPLFGGKVNELREEVGIVLQL